MACGSGFTVQGCRCHKLVKSAGTCTAKATADERRHSACAIRRIETPEVKGFSKVQIISPSAIWFATLLLTYLDLSCTGNAAFRLTVLMRLKSDVSVKRKTTMGDDDISLGMAGMEKPLLSSAYAVSLSTEVPGLDVMIEKRSLTDIGLSRVALSVINEPLPSRFTVMLKPAKFALFSFSLTRVIPSEARVRVEREL